MCRSSSSYNNNTTTNNYCSSSGLSCQLCGGFHRLSSWPRIQLLSAIKYWNGLVSSWKGIEILFKYTYLSKSIQFCLNNGGYLAELSTATKDTEINSHLHKDKYYWIGLKRTGPNKGQGHFLWQKSGKRPTHSLWWKDFMEPNGNGNCVFKDGWEQDDPRQFGWADFDCNLK